MKIFHGKHVEQGDKFAVEYANKYPTNEREPAIRAFQHGWEMFFDGVEPSQAWDRATLHASIAYPDDADDFAATRFDVLAGYNKADQYRKNPRQER